MCLMCPGQGELSGGYSMQTPSSQSSQGYSIQQMRQDSGNYGSAEIDYQ